MRLLLDTHALLWWWTDDPCLSPRARALLQDESTQVLVSAASAWEIAIKFRLGKLGLGLQVMERFDELIRLDGFTSLPISQAHALYAGQLEAEHRDPFDRMLAAQSRLERLPLLTRDAVFPSLGVEVWW